MSTNEALLTNCRAIQLVDDLDPDAAHALFRQNYRCLLYTSDAADD